MIDFDVLFKHYLNFFKFKSYRRYKKVLSKYPKVVPGNDGNASVISSKAFFRLNGMHWHYDWGRYTYLLIKSFHAYNFDIYLEKKYSLLSRLIKYKAFLQDIDLGMFDTGDAPFEENEKNVLLLRHNGVEKKVILVFPSGMQVLPENNFVMPYMMHPVMYHKGYYKEVVKYRENPSRMKILFAGNVDKKEYSRKILKERFNKTHRFEIISSLLKTGKKDEIELVTKKEQLIPTENKHDRLFIVRSSDYKIPFEQWLEVLSRAVFFLACSGSKMPMCHNVVEAMSVGTIPILEYPEFFSPPLEHKKNCIVYSGVDDLHEKIHEVLHMPSSEIIEMKANAIAYYEKWLTPETWVEQLVNKPFKNITLIMNAHLLPRCEEKEMA
ncbi:hypothetical protein [Ascidiimonas aurantiaca]|uniref:glycosyltransferase n=1 Tax=Ascidiimonas aurantiaca TaxID=1685432 RepID=UPI0030ECB187